MSPETISSAIRPAIITEIISSISLRRRLRMSVFGKGMGVVEHHVHQRVSGFMPCGKLLILIGHGHAPALAAPAHFVARLFQLCHADRLLVSTGGQEGGFIK